MLNIFNMIRKRFPAQEKMAYLLNILKNLGKKKNSDIMASVQSGTTNQKIYG